MQAEERYGQGGFICEDIPYLTLTLLDNATQTLVVASTSLSITKHTLPPQVMVPFTKANHADSSLLCVLGIIVHVPVCIPLCSSRCSTSLDQLGESHHVLKICEVHGLVR